MAPKVAIVASGPSAHLFDVVDREAFDHIIGVNGTVETYRCDYWAICDFASFWKWKPLGDPIICAREGSVTKGRRSRPEEYQRLQQHDVIYETSLDVPDIQTWDGFSGLLALGLAWHLDAARVYMFGADMTGQSDHKGEVKTASRTKHRWNVERVIFDKWARAYGEDGRELIRVLASRG